LNDISVRYKIKLDMDALEIARQAAAIASNKQASDILILDIRKVSSFAEFFVLCSGTSERQLDTTKEEITKGLKGYDVLPHHEEGSSQSGWLVIDYGNVIIHILTPEKREYYQLEKIWQNAGTILTIQ